MTKYLAPLFLVACCGIQPQTPHTSAAGDVESKTVALVEEGHAYCSGVWIGKDMIVTANHCVEDLDVGDHVGYAVRGDVSADDGDELEAVHSAKVAVQDPDHDLALLTVKLAPSHRWADIALDEKVGDPVQTMGHPIGMWWSYSQGVIASIRRMNIDNMDMWWIQSTASISPGNSGGGLFDSGGNLIGICDRYYPKGENLNMYVSARYVAGLLTAAAATP